MHNYITVKTIYGDEITVKKQIWNRWIRQD